MKLSSSNFINFKKNKDIPGLYDIEINHVQEIKKYDSVECHVVLYPYSRRISKDDYTFNPFEEYIKDITKNQKSAYQKIKSPINEFFGIFLGIIILLAFLKYRPNVLISVESIVGIFGAYFIGKDLWDDLEGFLMSISKNWRIKYQDSCYSYKLDKHSTLTQYSHYAKKQRYGKKALIPDRMEFIEHHNSSTARMYFTKEDMSLAEDNAHLFSISLQPCLVGEFEKQGYLFGVKISLNKKFLFLENGFDLFQSIDKGKKGCLDNSGNWLKDTVHYMRLLRIGRIKLYLEKGFWPNRIIIADK